VFFDLDDLAFFAPLVEPALALALLLAAFAEVERLDVRGAGLAPVPRLDELRFAVFLAGFDTSPRRASPAMVPNVDPTAAPALAGAPSRTSSRPAFRALLLAIAVTTAAVRASRTRGFLSNLRACFPTSRARLLTDDDFFFRGEPTFDLPLVGLGDLATFHLRN
jgi:hypothetical protein